MRTDPDQLSENLMQPVAQQKMSRRDIARARFVQQFRRKQRIKESARLTLQQELEFLKDFEDGVAGLKDKKYMELVEHIN